MSSQPPGCEHYKRKCALLAVCCNRMFACRLCHDAHSDHQMNRHDVQQLQCLLCGTRQKVRENCCRCGTKFGLYCCLVCRLFDDTDKQQFHCSGCGICRVGGRNNFFHCYSCGLCLAKGLKGKHKCVQEASRANCPICMEDLHSSVVFCSVPHCGHLVHSSCYKNMMKKGIYSCPTCGESLDDMSTLWKMLDAEVAATPMPKDYRDMNVQVLCKDCHKESSVNFHVVGLKCQCCGSYNTCRTATQQS
ncbi:RING finger and CHY zinc finger domain-containing protein 1-like [Corticium candelabrum]|uniref:RING finger and CHY zinc finger domain-containing protein 1-like n=1 Tax=Corticium candelabrum TaxID=121492 RepID=UPI002E2645DD|nr:RING finger and CHY zinc finger domain-containing protein 1-like [Corticium candelabrum]